MLCHCTSCLRIGNVKSVHPASHQQFEVCPRRPPKQVGSRWPCSCREWASYRELLKRKLRHVCCNYKRGCTLVGILRILHLWAWPWYIWTWPEDSQDVPCAYVWKMNILCQGFQTLGHYRHTETEHIFKTSILMTLFQIISNTGIKPSRHIHTCMS